MKLFKAKFFYLHYIPFYYYLLLFFTPLLMNSKTSEIFEFNKMIFVYFITIIVTFLYVIKYIIKPTKITHTFFTAIFLLFIISQLLSTIYSIDVLTSVFGYYGRWNGGLLSIISYFLLFFVFIQTFAKQQIQTLLKTSLASSAIVIVWGLLATVGYDFSCYIFAGSLTNGCWTAQFNPADRMFSTIGQPNWLGAYLAFHFFVGMYFLSRQFVQNGILQSIPSFRMTIEVILNKVKNPATLFYLTYLLFNILALYFTKSRSSLLALGVAGILGIVIFISKQFIIKKRTEEIVIIMFVLGIFATFFLGWKSGYIQQFFALPTKTTAVTDSFDIRKVVWKGAIDLGLRYPYFGTGVETFAYSYYFTRPEAHNLTSEWDFIYNKAHNEYVNYFATTGFVGISTYLLLIISVFILFWRYYELNSEKMKVEKDELLVTSLMLGYITILITNFFGFSVSTIQLLFYLTPAFVIALAQSPKEFKPLIIKDITIHKKIALTICSIIFIWSIWYLQNYYIADMNYANAKVKMAQNEYTEALVLLDTARKGKYEHVYEDKMSYTLANLAFIYSFSEEKERANRYIMLADVANVKTLEQSPENIQYWRTRGKNYYLFYQITNKEEDLQKALVAFEKVTAIAKSDVQSKYTLALFTWIASREVKDSDKSALLYGRALDEIRAVIDMKPNYIEAQELLSEMLAGV